MAKTDNLGDFLTDLTNALRTKEGSVNPIPAQDISTRILALPSPKPEETKTIALPSFASGDIVVTPDSGRVLTSVTLSKDTTNHIAGNIKKDVTLYGVVGTFAGGSSLPINQAVRVFWTSYLDSETPDIANYQVVLTDGTTDTTISLSATKVDTNYGYGVGMASISLGGNHTVKSISVGSNHVGYDSGEISICAIWNEHSFYSNPGADIVHIFNNALTYATSYTLTTTEQNALKNVNARANLTLVIDTGNGYD